MNTGNHTATLIVDLNTTACDAARFSVADIEQAITTMVYPNGQPRGFEVRVLSIDEEDLDDPGR